MTNVDTDDVRAQWLGYEGPGIEVAVARVREAIEELRTNAGIAADAGLHELAYSYRDDADRIERALDGAS